jgi:PEP-CTERM motif
MRRHKLLFFAALLCGFSGVVSAGPITYDVTVNTSSITGTAGSLDFNFNPGPLVTQAASVQILNFMSNGSLVNCAANVQTFCNTGDVSGTLPATLTFNNDTAFNDYFDDFTFGTTISFDVSVYGPALSAPNGTATSGSTFAFSMFSDADGTIPALTTDTVDGFAFTVGVNLNGSTTVTPFSSETNVSTPEPGTFVLLGTALACVGVLRLRRP